MTVKAPPKEKWRINWMPEEVPKLEALATKFRLRGAMNDLAAWQAAENHFKNRTDPFLRKR